MGGSCCKSSGDNIEIKFSQTNKNRIRYNNNNNNIKLNITNGSGYPTKMNINPNWSFNEIKKKYCILQGKKDDNKLIFVYKGKVIEENNSLNSMGIEEEITICAFDGNDYNT